MRLKVSVVVDVDTTDTDIEDMRDEILEQAIQNLDLFRRLPIEDGFDNEHEVIIKPLSKG